MRLIDADALKKSLEKLWNIHTDQVFSNKDVWREIENAPIIEPEREKGKWIDEKINSYTSRTYCSECGSSAPFVYKSDDYYGNHAHGETAMTKFCPNCGAEME